MTTEGSEPRPLSISRTGFFWGFWTLLGAMFVGYVWNVRPSLSPNDNARWDTIWSLVEDGTYVIEPQNRQFPTIDKVVRRHDGAVVSSKPPLLPTVAAGYVAVWRRVLGEPFSKDAPVPGKPTKPGSIHIYGKLVLIAFNVLPMLLMLWLYRRYLDRAAQTDFAWTFSLVAMGLGTLVTGYLATLNNHVVAATWGFVAVYNLLRIWYDDRQERWRYALAGLLVGWTAANELPAGLFAILATGVLLWKNPVRCLVAFVPPLALVAAAFFYTNFLAVGDPERPWQISNFTPAYLQKDLYQTDIDGKPSYWKAGNPDRSAIDALNDHPEPKWLYALHSTIGHHGLFSLSPVLLFCVWGWLLASRGRGRKDDEAAPFPLRGFAWLLGFLTAAVFCFYLFVTDQRNYGGFCHGLRWMLWLTPMWMLFLPVALDGLRDRRRLPPLAWGALAVSVLSAFDALHNPWTRSWLHRILLYFNVVDY